MGKKYQKRNPNKPQLLRNLPLNPLKIQSPKILKVLRQKYRSRYQTQMQKLCKINNLLHQLEPQPKRKPSNQKLKGPNKRKKNKRLNLQDNNFSVHKVEDLNSADQKK